MLKIFSAGGQAEIPKIIHIGTEIQVKMQLVVHVLRLDHVKGLRALSMWTISSNTIVKLKS